MEWVISCVMHWSWYSWDRERCVWGRQTNCSEIPLLRNSSTFDADSYACHLCFWCWQLYMFFGRLTSWACILSFVLCCASGQGRHFRLSCLSCGVCFVLWFKVFFWNVLCYAYALNARHMPGSIHISSHFGSIQHYSAWRSLCWSHANIVAYPLSIWNTVHVEFHIVMSIANYKIGHCINMLVGHMPSRRLS